MPSAAGVDVEVGSAVKRLCLLALLLALPHSARAQSDDAAEVPATPDAPAEPPPADPAPAQPPSTPDAPAESPPAEPAPTESAPAVSEPSPPADAPAAPSQLSPAADAQSGAEVEEAQEAEPREDEAQEVEEEAEEEAEEEQEDAGYSHRGIELPGDLQLHGMFDVGYERHGYTDDPTDGQHALRNYHHFLFLRREVRGDPLSLEVELIDLTFYEIGLRLSERGDPWQLDIKLGKILVPFGDEPLFHHLYGGQSGFDQRFVPAVWARHGASVRMRRRIGDLSLQNDAYVVQGHSIDASDAVIDLQRDLSSADDARLAVGDRVGLSWDAITVWYSLYYSRLGFDRQLLLQAIDVGIHRLRDVPVLEDLAISVGVARADVSGGTWTEERVPLEHYYHFADYLQLRYYLLDWLRIDARTGVLTTNNRKGVYRDDARDDVTDVDTHNLGVSMRYRGLSASLHHVWRLEARDERTDDFMRLRIGYAF